MLWEEIYPALFEVLNDVLPEFEFKKIPTGWQSTNGHKSDGSEGQKGKVYVYENNLTKLIDYTRSHVSIWDYIKERDSLDQRQTLLRLAQLAGVSLASSLTPAELDQVGISHRESKLWESINDYCIDCLSGDKNPIALTNGAANLQDYLINTRKYHPSYFRLPGSKADHKVPKMELGYMPPLQDLVAHLETLGFSAGEVSSLLSDIRIGNSHTLSMPYRDASGRMRGMIFRAIYGQEPKYLYSAGLEKNNILFNLRAIRGDRDLVIVEGQLDAYHASAIGIDNVVALGGNALTDGQIRAAVKSGAKKFTFLFDNDKGGDKGLTAALGRLKAQSNIKVFVGTFPEGIKDIDQQILEQGPDAAKDTIANAERLEEFRLRQLLAKYQILGQNNQDNSLTIKQEHDFFEEIVEIILDINSPIDRAMFIKTVSSTTQAKDVGVTEKALSEAVDRIRIEKEKVELGKDVKSLLEKAGELQKKGEPDKVLDLVSSTSTDIKAKTKKTTFGALNVPPTEESIAERQRNKPKGLPTSYWIDEGMVQIELPAGALTILAAPTSHGKTTLLNNFGLDVALLYPQKRFHFFSYEEDADVVLMKALNAFINETLCEGNNNLRAIQHFFSTGKLTYIKEPMRGVFLDKKKIFFDELISTGCYNIHYVNYDADTLGEACEYLAQDPDTGAIFIDYAQLLNLPSNKYKTFSRQEELKTICLNLKDVAVATGLPIVLGAQFNRQVTHHLKMHATMIGEAGDIERAANLIIGLWNNVYDPFGATDKDLEEIERKSMNIPDTIYAKALKFRGGRPNVSDNWPFNGNTGKVANKYGLSPASISKSKPVQTFGDFKLQEVPEDVF